MTTKNQNARDRADEQRKANRGNAEWLALAISRQRPRVLPREGYFGDGAGGKLDGDERDTLRRRKP